jgi:hypothetical protein
MPQLRRDEPARRVNVVYHLLPTGERRFAMEVGDIRLVRCGLPVDTGRLRYDETDAILRPAAIISGDLGGRHATRRERPGHRSHDDAVRQVESFQPVGAQQDIKVWHGISQGCEGRRLERVNPGIGPAVPPQVGGNDTMLALEQRHSNRGNRTSSRAETSRSCPCLPPS